ncbi:MAG: 30S ribosomal protein S17e [Candidatus Heimdallarchaeota archaeon]
MNIKRWALQIVEQYPDKFTTDFQVNQRLITELTPISSKFFRNKIAGYIVRLVKEKQ